MMYELVIYERCLARELKDMSVVPAILKKRKCKVCKSERIIVDDKHFKPFPLSFVKDDEEIVIVNTRESNAVKIKKMHLFSASYPREIKNKLSDSLKEKKGIAFDRVLIYTFYDTREVDDADFKEYTTICYECLLPLLRNNADRIESFGSVDIYTKKNPYSVSAYDVLIAKMMNGKTEMYEGDLELEERDLKIKTDFDVMIYMVSLPACVLILILPAFRGNYAVSLSSHELGEKILQLKEDEAAVLCIT